MIKKDLFFDFYTPVYKNRAKGFDLSIGRAGSKKPCYLYFPSHTIKRIGGIDRLSVKFYEGDIFFIFNVPIDSGNPFYKLNKNNKSKGQQLANSDLATKIVTHFPSDGMVYIDLEDAGEIGGIHFYKLKKTQ